ncbi:ATM interactor-like [Anopheles aquasalis]|uniref:ATM interactor-like n=1 Tax=Anopheles aquasalis TaxID=42839 RepID=UPI00215AFC24|nr:ATM interactor-like [Anopheles aquasalis]
MNPEPPQRTTAIAKVCLSREEILASKLYTCAIGSCDEVFRNAAHLQLHVLRRHKLEPNRDRKPPEGSQHFYCPSPHCPYHQQPLEEANGARHFLSFRSLKQHFLKVHEERTVVCTGCDKTFATESYLRHHLQSCGRTFTCDHCSASYGSRESLLTHARRKGHGYDSLVANGASRGARKRRKSPSTTATDHAAGAKSVAVQTVNNLTDRATQTTQSHRPEQDLYNYDQPSAAVASVDAAVAATDLYPVEPATGRPLFSVSLMGSLAPSSDSETSTPVVCTETQTDFIDVMLTSAINRHDPMLSYTHMCTQTSDMPAGLLTDLGLSTIETQTCWSEDGTGESFGDFLVSTETQTNFDIDCFSCTGSNDGCHYSGATTDGDRSEPEQPISNCKQTQAPEHNCVSQFPHDWKRFS